jgi:hypothetical protein
MTANFAARRSVLNEPARSMKRRAAQICGGLRLGISAYRQNAVILLRPEVIVRHDGRREREDWPALSEPADLAMVP